MQMIQLSLFRGVHDTQPRPVTLEEVVTMMRTDQSVRDLTEKHRYARSTGDEQGAPGSDTELLRPCRFLSDELLIPLECSGR